MMDLEKMYVSIEKNRRENERSSLPIFFKDKNVVMWFNYRIINNSFLCRSTKVFIADTNFLAITSFAQVLEASLSDEDEETEEELSEEDYYMGFETHSSVDEYLGAIAETTEAPFLPLYKTVINWVMDYSER